MRIGRMIAYQEYNTKSPLNGLAAKWAAQNSHLLPIDPRPVAPPSRDERTEEGTRRVEMSSRLLPVSDNRPGGSDRWSEKIVIG
jgi:hypothetical protein